MKAPALGEMLGLLAAVVMGTLVVGPAEGLVLSKCELKAELEAVLPDMEDEDGMVGPFKMQDVLAKIVCKVEFTTQFNTSTVTVLGPPLPGWPGEGDEGSGSAAEEGEGEIKPADKPEREKSASPRSHQVRPPWMPRRRGKRAWKPPQESEEALEEKEVELEASSWTLYGLFQLADRVVCESEDMPSLNICQMPCTDLTDDDISDDIECVRELKRTHQKMIFDPKKKFLAIALRSKLMSMMFPRECSFVDASGYFAECL